MRGSALALLACKRMRAHVALLVFCVATATAGTVGYGDTHSCVAQWTRQQCWDEAASQGYVEPAQVAFDVNTNTQPTGCLKVTYDPPVVIQGVTIAVTWTYNANPNPTATQECGQIPNAICYCITLEAGSTGVPPSSPPPASGAWYWGSLTKTQSSCDYACAQAGLPCDDAYAQATQMHTQDTLPEMIARMEEANANSGINYYQPGMCASNSIGSKWSMYPVLSTTGRGMAGNKKCVYQIENPSPPAPTPGTYRYACAKKTDGSDNSINCRGECRRLCFCNFSPPMMPPPALPPSPPST